MKKDWNKIYEECMTELYANAEPSADFLMLLSIAKEKNDRAVDGRLIFPCDDYLIDSNSFDSIFNGIVKKYKIKEPWLSSFRMEIYLGASPKTIWNDKD